MILPNYSFKYLKCTNLFPHTACSFMRDSLSTLSGK